MARATVGNVSVRITAKVRDYLRGMTRAEKKTRQQQLAQKRLERQYKRTTRALKNNTAGIFSARNAIGLLAGGGGLGLLVKSSATANKEIIALSRSLNISQNTLVDLRTTFTQYGIEQDKIVRVLRAMQRRWGEAQGGLISYASTYDILGLKVREADGRLREFNEETLFEAFRAIQRLAKQSKSAAAAAAEIIASQKVRPIFSALVDPSFADAFEAAKEINTVTDQHRANIEKVNDSYDTLVDVATDLRDRMVEVFSPQLEKSINNISAAMHEMAKNADAVGKAVERWTGWAVLIGKIALAFFIWGRALKLVSGLITLIRGAGVGVSRVWKSIVSGAAPAGREAKRQQGIFSRIWKGIKGDAEAGGKATQEAWAQVGAVAGPAAVFAAPAAYKGVRNLLAEEEKAAKETASVIAKAAEARGKVKRLLNGDEEEGDTGVHASLEKTIDRQREIYTAMTLELEKRNNTLADSLTLSGLETDEVRLQRIIQKQALDARNKLLGIDKQIAALKLKQADADKNQYATAERSIKGLEAQKAAYENLESLFTRIQEAAEGVGLEDYLRGFTDYVQQGGDAALKTLKLTQEEADIAIKLFQQFGLLTKQQEKQLAEGRIQEAIDDISGSIGDTFESIITGTAKSRDAVKALLKDIALAVLRAQVIQPIVNSINQGLSGIFGGGEVTAAARGGVHRGLTLVGEKGPELLNLGDTSRIFPNDELMGALSGAGRAAPVVNFTVHAIDREGLRKVMAEEAPRLKEYVEGALFADSRRPGRRRTMLRGT